jgi:hypothetical protein
MAEVRELGRHAKRAPLVLRHPRLPNRPHRLGHRRSLARDACVLEVNVDAVLPNRNRLELKPWP